MIRAICVLLCVAVGFFSVEGFAENTKAAVKKTDKSKKDSKKRKNTQNSKKEDVSKKGDASKKKEAAKKKDDAPKKSTTSAKQEPKLLGTFGNWKAYETLEDGKKVCYMASFPEKQNGNYSKRGNVYVLVAHRPHIKSYDVVSFDAGYTYKKGSKTTVEIDKKKFNLFTDQETAWCTDSKTDTRLLQCMLKGAKITVSGESAKGTKTTDTYSLSGSSAAYKAICEACNVKRG